MHAGRGGIPIVLKRGMGSGRADGPVDASPNEGVTGPGGGSPGQFDGLIPSPVLVAGGLVLLLLGGFRGAGGVRL